MSTHLNITTYTSPLMHSQPDYHRDFVERLSRALGSDKILLGAAIEPYATDVYRSLHMPLAVARPATVAELQTAVRTATEAGVAVFTRGGGASYTDGYLPTRPDSLLIDMSGLNRVVEINATDGYVTVEAGITWAALKAALDARGLRTPFFGPFSGIAATVGGSVSQHAVSHGSAAHGVSAQSVISLDIVTASGKLLRTGSAARGSAPFMRWYGPDMAGLFTGDCGVLGIKSQVTLVIRKRLPAYAYASYGFDSLETMAQAMRSVALEGIDDEHFAMDVSLARGQLVRASRISKFATAKNLVDAAPSKLAALTQLIRTALAGTRQLNAAAYTVHYIMEGFEQRDANIKARRLKTLMRQSGGGEIANTVPALTRGMPFAPLFNTLGPNGERWVPVHGYLPHSAVKEFHAATNAFMKLREADMQRLQVRYGGMFMTLGTTAFLYELAFYWPGALSPYHRHTLPAEYLSALPQTPHNPEVAAYVDQLKKDFVALLSRYHAVPFQLGKMYPYGSVLAPESLALIRSIKKSLDPNNLMNPGGLEL
jgi:glycolate oxidase